jgi:hypothetical protein
MVVVLMLKWFGSLGGSLLSATTLLSCLPKQASDSEAAYAVGSWWSDSSSNLLTAVKANAPLTVCLSPHGTVEPSALTRDETHFYGLTQKALRAWMSGLSVSPDIRIARPPCKNDLAQGFLHITLHYDVNHFQQRLAQTTSPTLGVFLVGDGQLHLNVPAVLNPARDPTKGYKTILHELGHGMGLNHSDVPGAVMMAYLNRARNELTQDDINGIRDVWARLGSQKTTPTPAATTSDNARHEPPAAEPAASRPQEFNAGRLKLRARYDTWLKATTAQSYELSDAQKCFIKLNDEIYVERLSGAQLTAGHIQVRLIKPIAGCPFGSAGATAYLYNQHID